MSEMLGSPEEKIKKIKELLKRIHQGENVDSLREEFRDVIKGLTPMDIIKIEQELIAEGMSQEEVQKFCDLHLGVLRDAVEKGKPELPEWHPVYILMEEHRMQLDMAGMLREVAKDILNNPSEELISRAREIAQHIKGAENHYLREENVLFPLLEKHGVVQPPAIMWSEHDRIREIKKNLVTLVDSLSPSEKDKIKELYSVSLSLAEMLLSHFYKENNILFPTALRLFTQEEWIKARKDFDEVGYCCFIPPPLPSEIEEKKELKIEGGRIVFETGSMSREELEAVLNTLPVDITFVDKNDVVRYFNQSKDRIFVRTKSVIGRKVQQCHPKKSIDIVNRIIEDFKTGKRDVAEFWINFQGRLVYIRYFPVRNKEGEFLGVLEVTQDVTKIKKLEGEKRLLDY